MKRGKTLDWIPLWVDKWLFGSTRIELQPDERSIWADFMVLASKDNGYIRANEDTAYPIELLAGMLYVEKELLEKTISKLAGKKIGKIRLYKSGIIYLKNWKEYQLTDRHKRRFEPTGEPGHVRENGHGVPKTGPYSKKKKDINNINNNNTETYKEIIRLLNEVKGIGKEKAKKLTEFIFEKLVVEFKDVDPVEQVKKKCAWWIDNPLNKKSNIHAQMRNWFRLGQKWINEAKAQDRVGQAKPQKPKTKDELECERLMKEAEDKILDKKLGISGREIEFLVMAARETASRDFWGKKVK